MLKKISLLAVLCAVSACSSAPVTQVQAMQKKDKQLSCKEVLLEMNEAQFYQKMAQKNKGPQLKNILMPLGYISTYMNAEDAIQTASARVDYLDKIYGIMDCEAQKANGWQSQASYYAPGAPQGNPQMNPAQYQANAGQYMGTSYPVDPRMQGAPARLMPAPTPVYRYQDEQMTAPNPQQRMY